ncbi:MAG: sigma-54 dependent transcriptional regulator [Rhodothermales bacterium]
MKEFGHILVVDDNADVLQAMRLFLKRHAAAVRTEEDPDKIPGLVGSEDYDAILLDMNFSQGMTSGKEGLDWLQRILAIDPTAVVVLMTAYGDVATAVDAIKHGATDFVLKPWTNERLLATLSSAAKLRKSLKETTRLKTTQELLKEDIDRRFPELVGGLSASMQRVFETIEKVARTDASVLILGENGTGKELVARALHRASNRSTDVFVPVDMGAIPESLFESELFGHVKGAFTDAHTDRAGRFEVASGGTLFLDEIGNVSTPMQAKILSAIQRKEIVRVGSTKSTSIDVRLICATNMPIYEMVKDRTFRQDLLYRINTVEIRIPALRERREDIPVLVDHFLKRYGKKYDSRVQGVSPDALARMKAYSWPGNVRELEHMIERALIMTETPLLQSEDFFFAGDPGSHDADGLASFNLEDVERTIIRKALTLHDGNISQAANELGLSRAALYRRLEKYGL